MTTEASSSPSSRPQLIYLDQHIWVQLLRGATGSSSTPRRVKDELIARRAVGNIRVPLAASHYLETWHRRSEDSRHALAGLMRDLSQYDTLAPVHRMEWLEVAWLVARMAAPHLSFPAPKSFVLGRGVNHAFDSPIGRFRVVSAIATETSAEGEPLEASDALLEAGRAGGDAWEWINLSGPENFLRIEGIEVAPEHRLGDQNVQFETDVRELLRGDSTIRRRLDDFIVVQEMARILEYVNTSCERLGIDPHGLITEGASSIRGFVEGVPVANVIYRLRLHQQRDFGHPIEQHDRTDFATLALAVPYCDAVVTERRWCHAIRQAKLDELYGTYVCASLEELEVFLHRQ